MKTLLARVENSAFNPVRYLAIFTIIYFRGVYDVLLNYNNINEIVTILLILCTTLISLVVAYGIYYCNDILIEFYNYLSPKSQLRLSNKLIKKIIKALNNKPFLNKLKFKLIYCNGKVDETKYRIMCSFSENFHSYVWLDINHKCGCIKYKNKEYSFLDIKNSFDMLISEITSDIHMMVDVNMKETAADRDMEKATNTLRDFLK